MEKVTITTKCTECGTVFTLEVNKDAYDKYVSGQSTTQDLFPSLTPGERELHFISGICQDCWESLFKEDDDADWEYGDFPNDDEHIPEDEDDGDEDDNFNEGRDDFQNHDIDWEE